MRFFFGCYSVYRKKLKMKCIIHFNYYSQNKLKKLKKIRKIAIKR